MRSKFLQSAICLGILLVGVESWAQQYADWSAPVKVAGPVNSTSVEETPFLSRDGLHLYFTSDRPGGFGGSDIWVATRASVGAPWGEPLNLGPEINTADNESHPTLSVDGHVLYFDRTMPADGGTFDMFSSRRQDKSNDLGWTEAVNVGPCINTPANDSGMIFFEDDATGTTYTYFNSNRSGFPDFYVTIFDREGACVPVMLVTDLNTPYVERNATIRHDGLEILFESTRPGSQFFDIWVATRPSIYDPWSTPANVGVLNSPAYDGRPAFSWDATELYFFSNRDGNFDLYVSTRQKIDKP